MRDRAYRRYQYQKRKQKALRVKNQQHWWDNLTEEQKIKNAARIANNLTDCSCQMCCNPRRSKWSKTDNKLTMQERRALLDEKDAA